jgi:hypothetical protein
VKGAGSSSRSPTRAKKGHIEIGQWEKRMEGKKTRTLELHKDAAPKVRKRYRPSGILKVWLPRA